LLDKNRKTGRPQLHIRNSYADALSQLLTTMKTHAELEEWFVSVSNPY
jgi:hypothetical protein